MSSSSYSYKKQISTLLDQLDCVTCIRKTDSSKDESTEKQESFQALSEKLDIGITQFYEELQKFYNKETPGYNTDFLAVQLPAFVKKLNTPAERWSLLGYEHFLEPAEVAAKAAFDPKAGDLYGIMLLFLPRTIFDSTHFDAEGLFSSKTTLKEIYKEGERVAFPYYWIPMARSIAEIEVDRLKQLRTTVTALTAIRVLSQSSDSTKLSNLDYENRELLIVTSLLDYTPNHKVNLARENFYFSILENKIMVHGSGGGRRVGVYRINPEHEWNLSHMECLKLNGRVMQQEVTVGGGGGKMSNQFANEFGKLITEDFGTPSKEPGSSSAKDGIPQFSSSQLNAIFKKMRPLYMLKKHQKKEEAEAALYILDASSAGQKEKGSINNVAHIIALPGVDLFNDNDSRFVFMNGSVHKRALTLCRQWMRVQSQSLPVHKLTLEEDEENRVLRFKDTELPEDFPPLYKSCAASLVKAAAEFNKLMRILLESSEIESNRVEAVMVILRQYSTSFSSTNSLLRDLLQSSAEVIGHAVRAQHASELIPRPRRRDPNIEMFIKHRGDQNTESFFVQFEKWRGYYAYVWLKRHLYTHGDWNILSGEELRVGSTASERLKREANGYYLDQKLDTHSHLYMRRYPSKEEAAQGSIDGEDVGYASDASSQGISSLDMVKDLHTARDVPEDMLCEVANIFGDFTSSQPKETIVRILDGYEARHCLISSLLFAFRERIVFMASVFATALGADRSRLYNYLHKQAHQRLNTHDTIQELFHVVLEETAGVPAQEFSAAVPSTIREQHDLIYYRTVVPDLRNIIVAIERLFLLNCLPTSASVLDKKYNQIAQQLQFLAEHSISTETASYPAPKSSDIHLLLYDDDDSAE